MQHVVEQGECLSGIAKYYGFTDWQKIYNDPRNAEFKRKRPNPNLIYPGDVLFIPDKETKEESGGTEQKHRFRKKSQTLVLRIAAADPEKNRLANAQYELIVEGQVFSGTTDAEGLLEHEIPLDAQQGKLTIGQYEWQLSISHLNPIEESQDQGVSGAQGRLKNLAYDVGPIDGILGPKTREAIKQFQKDHGLEQTGQLNSATRSKLVEVHGC